MVRTLIKLFKDYRSLTVKINHLERDIKELMALEQATIQKCKQTLVMIENSKK